MRRLIAAAGAGFLLMVPAALASAPRAGAPDPSHARARAWALHVGFTTDRPHAIALATASSESGARHEATAAPLDLDGNAPQRASAAHGSADDVKTPWTYTDSTGSASMDGWYAEAHAPPGSASARAGVYAMTGSGFAMASELFTWEQQEQLLGQWMETNELVFGQLNAALSPLAPAARAAGLDLPRFEGIAPIGFVDFSAARELASGAESASNPGFASARAETSLSRLRLLGGFIDVEGISAEATSEQAGDTATLDAAARIGKLRVAGVEVDLGGGGLEVAGNDVVSRAVIAPTFDAVLDALQAAGIGLRVVGTREDGLSREAGVLEVSAVTPQGTIVASIGHAEASAQAGTVAGEAGVPARSSGFALPTSPLGGTAARGQDVGAETPIGQELTQPRFTAAAPVARGPVARTLPPSAVRGARTAFLVLLVGAALAALLFPQMLGQSVMRTPAMRTKESRR